MHSEIVKENFLRNKLQLIIKSIRIYMFTTTRVLNVQNEMSRILWEIFELDLTNVYSISHQTL